MGRESTARKLTYGEVVAQQLAHDSRLMASIDQAMVDVDAHRVLSIEEFEKALEQRSGG